MITFNAKYIAKMRYCIFFSSIISFNSKIFRG